MSPSNLLSGFTLSRKRGKLINKKALPSYEYIPIDEAAHEIRLLTLHHGKRRDPIMISLTNTPITVNNVPAFEALSYTWGSPENPTHVFVTNPSGKSGTISVTKNLGEALPYLRYEERDRVLWTDALCVNQRDLEERSRQVQRIAEIYTKAVRVVAWLGPSTELTPIAIKCFNTITSKVKGDPNTAVLEAISNDLSWADLTVAPPFSDQECFAMMEFFSSEWFERLWIQQEIRLSSVESILISGQYIISWYPFRTVVQFLALKIHLRNPSQFLKDRVEIAFNIANAQIHETDRIYALLSLVHGPGITPDYTKGLQDVYKDAFKSIVASTGGLNILPTVVLDESTQWTPTWVPDWSRPKSSNQIGTQNASCISTHVPQFLSERIMQVEGLIIDSIVVVEPFQWPRPPPNSESGPCREAEVLELKRVVSRVKPMISEMDEFELRSMCQTLCTGEFSNNFIPLRKTWPNSLQAVKHIREMLCTKQNVWSSLYLSLFAMIGYRADGNSLCKTDKGQIIFGSKMARQGDIVSVLLGCSNPMILRPIQSGAFKVVVEAYHDEIAHGEALVGSIPKGFSYVAHRWDEDTKRTQKVIVMYF